MSDTVGRVGVVGTENSHAELIVRHLCVEHRLPPWRVVALHGPNTDRNESLADLGAAGGNRPAVVSTVEEMVPLVDAVIITDRDGGLHRAHAEPFLAAGIPVLVDKPLTTSIDDAESILASAAATGALVTSYSALRWAPVVGQLARDVSSGALNPAAAFAVGPAELKSEYGGIFYYGVHPVEALCHVLPGEFGPVEVVSAPDRLVAHFTIGSVSVTLVLLQPAEGEWAPFHLSLAGRNEVAGGDIVLPGDYLMPGLERFFEMVSSGEAPLNTSDLLRPVELLSAIRKATGAAEDA
jgi:predicted dehydrogenase